MKVNFRPANTPVPAGYVADTGSVFADRANGFSYGWDADNSVNARVRNDPLLAERGLRFVQPHAEERGRPRGGSSPVPNGLYVVTLAAGDPDATDSVYKFNLEGSLALSGTPGGLTHWYRSTTVVQVTDGRLTLTNAAGAQNNKINFVEVQAAGLGAVPGPVTGSQPILLKFPSGTGLTSAARHRHQRRHARLTTCRRSRAGESAAHDTQVAQPELRSSGRRFHV